MDTIQKTLDLAFEHTQKLLDHEVHVWSPWEDDGLTYTLNDLNTGKEWNHGGIKGLDSALGPHKLFLDVGSNLGLTAMGISLTYPGTAVVAIEPAAPSWLMQELNLRCNSLSPQPHIRSVLAGVGPKNDGLGKVMWRPSSTTSTRTWTPKSEHKDDDIELTIHLRNIRTILSEGIPDDLPYSTPISVMNLDCEGCEYDLVPSLTEADFDAIDIVLGELHWGYIPSEKLPSSDRGRKTHERLCRHEAFARDKIECCAFPDLEVDTLVDTASTVKELSGSLCDGFDTWAEEHHLNDIPDDVGWFELSAEWDY
jgi:FkbM family methyltransferase